MTIRSRKGFSLIELLAGFALIGVLLGTTNVMLFSTLRSARKASAIGTAKSEGAYALNAMAQMIKFAGEINCQGGADSNQLDVVKTNGQSFYYTFAAERIASVSAVTIDLTSSNLVVRLCPGWATVFRCDAAANPRSVAICFAADVTGTPIPGEEGNVNFQTQVVLRNFGN
jgi:prepilin-type N-terminal cleavage/methylation domain-containing protein